MRVEEFPGKKRYVTLEWPLSTSTCCTNFNYDISAHLFIFFIENCPKLRTLGQLTVPPTGNLSCLVVPWTPHYTTSSLESRLVPSTALTANLSATSDDV